MKKSFIGKLCVLVLVFFAACDKDDDKDNNLSKIDRNFITQASYANNAEIAAGAVAAAKGSDSAVRSYGAHMVTEHTTAQDELRNLASKWGIETPLTPDSMHIALVQRISTLQGLAFDTAYMKSQVMDHIVAIELFQQEATNGENRKLRAYANKYLPHVRMHKVRADSILARLQ
ncbi:DUF4142 domain-containing protein [Longitalea luteola]|uniref:DUF4142 domain-containing protein n=1 Tax=Longitalea luteola TaxID=2812563 RepID=UPI001A957D38|nr:DUF4142 domain-containing protein [Longitalea luteola]